MDRKIGSTRERDSSVVSENQGVERHCRRARPNPRVPTAVAVAVPTAKYKTGDIRAIRQMPGIGFKAILNT
jgi:hypothetical protein